MCVCGQGYFRSVSREDVEDVLPAFSDDLADPVHLVPPPGRLHFSPEEDDAGPQLASTPLHSLTWQPQQPLLKDRVSELKAQAAVEVSVVCQKVSLHIPHLPWQVVEGDCRRGWSCTRRLLRRRWQPLLHPWLL
jgi:hypothetical protein